MIIINIWSKLIFHTGPLTNNVSDLYYYFTEFEKKKKMLLHLQQFERRACECTIMQEAAVQPVPKQTEDPTMQRLSVYSVFSSSWICKKIKK